MRSLPSPEEMGAADRAAIEAGTPAEVLMERAGRAVARSAATMLGGRYGRRVVVVCGKGNNGGDGFVAARRLYEMGLGVNCFVLDDPTSFKGASATHLDRMVRSGIAPQPFAPGSLGAPDLIVDAIFGTGFRGSAEGDAAAAIEAINSAGARVMAVDIPSGVNGTTGTISGPAVRADVTVAMGAMKVGSALAPGSSAAGRVVVADIGIAVEESTAFEPEIADVAAVLPARRPDSHKRANGSVVVLGGSTGMSGAALLSARAAGRAGAGYVTVGSTSYVDEPKRVLLPDVLSVVDDSHDVLGQESLDLFREVLDRADAVALGPGLGRGERQAGLVRRVLGEIEVPLVVDADGLNVLAGHTEWLSSRSGPAVVTPHPGEMAGLLDVSSGDVQADRVETAVEAARRLGCVVLLKGAGTVVAEPSKEKGRVVVNPTGGPELATAGTGDVLTGVIAALLAAGVDTFAAAWAGAFVHGLAGEVAGRTRGGRGVLAWDVAEAIPRAVAEILG